MKTTLSVLAAVCVVIAGYIGIRHFTHKDLGFTPARKYVRGLANSLLHTEVTAAQEAGATPQPVPEQAV
jgi:hypothetical protein